MSIGKRESETRSAAEGLAKALRSGLELRWSIPSPPLGAPASFPPHGHVRPFLEPYADSLNFAPPRRRPLLLRGLRAIRFGLRKLLGPWLRVQTLFNLSAVSVLEQVEQRVQSLEETEHTLRQTIERLEKTIRSRTDRPSSDQGETLSERFEPCMTGREECTLEPIFIHTHLPRPPARLLALGCAGCSNAFEMARLGFEVVGVDPRPLPQNHPNLTMIQANFINLPFDDESFDAAVAFSTLGHDSSDEQAVAEVFRVLRRGGRFLATAPYRDRLDCLPAAFRIVERGYGVREGNAWSCTLDEQKAEQADNTERVSAIHLLVLEKP